MVQTRLILFSVILWVGGSVADFMLPSDSLLNVTAKFDVATSDIIKQLGMSRTDAKAGMEQVIPILQSYEDKINGINMDVLALVEDFNQTFLDDWTSSLQQRLMNFDINMKDTSSKEIILSDWRSESKEALGIIELYQEKHEVEEKKREEKIQQIELKIENLFQEIEGKVFPIIDGITVDQEGFDKAMKQALETFGADANGIIRRAVPNATKIIEETLDLQEEAWLQYVEQFLGEMETLRGVITANTSGVRVWQALQQSLDETEGAVGMEEEFVDKLRGLLVLTGPLIFCSIVVVLLMGMVAAACVHFYRAKRIEYRRLFPKRYRPVRGPERHYDWARRKC